MQFQPKTKEELALENLIPAGVYPFSVMGAEETLSKKDNPMIVVTLRFYCGNREITIKDYLLPSMPQKLEQFCRFVGLEPEYMAGNLEAENCEGKEGYAFIKIKPANGDFPAKNEVSYYTGKPESGAEETKPKPPRRDPFPPGSDSDDIDF